MRLVAAIGCVALAAGLGLFMVLGPAGRERPYQNIRTAMPHVRWV